tara:strand:- start:303 stop:530 length:228 start_codon:yes stop_codon:yes gene_type:complete
MVVNNYKKSTTPRNEQIGINPQSFKIFTPTLKDGVNCLKITMLWCNNYPVIYGEDLQNKHNVGVLTPYFNGFIYR